MIAKPKIAVVCAHNDCNMGMYSVDLAALSFFSDLGFDFDLVVTQTGLRRGARFLKLLFDNEQLIRRKKRFGKMQFKLLADGQDFKQYSHVVYWGDFLNNPVYRKIFSEVDVRLGHSRSFEAAFERWASLYLHANGKQAERVISIGGNFQNQLNTSDLEVACAYQSLVNNFDVIMPRDEFSTANLRACLPSGQKAILKQGLDCAFLLKQSRSPRGGYFAYHFGRSGFKAISSLLSQVERRTGLQGRQLDGWLKAEPRTVDGQFIRNRRLIADAEFVLSDTYHVCVNALASNVPAVGLGRATSKQLGTLGDFKKATLFSMFGAGAAYLAQEDESEDEFFAKVVRVTESQAHDADWSATFALLDKKVHQFKADILYSLAI